MGQEEDHMVGSQMSIRINDILINQKENRGRPE